jgi:hypothetical protein
MISNDNELQTTMKRIERFQNQLAYLRKTETNPDNYHASASGLSLRLTACNLKFENI